MTDAAIECFSGHRGLRSSRVEVREGVNGSGSPGPRLSGVPQISRGRARGQHGGMAANSPSLGPVTSWLTFTLAPFPAGQLSEKHQLPLQRRPFRGLAR
jgi:hypothetical protein